MNIIKSEPFSNGSYPSPNKRDDITAPAEGFAEVPESFDLTEFYTVHGFGVATFTDNVLTAFTPDETAWNAWQAEHPAVTPEPTIEERTTALEATQSDVIDVLASALGVTI